MSQRPVELSGAIGLVMTDVKVKILTVRKYSLPILGTAEIRLLSRTCPQSCLPDGIPKGRKIVLQKDVSRDVSPKNKTLRRWFLIHRVGVPQFHLPVMHAMRPYHLVRMIKPVSARCFLPPYTNPIVSNGHDSPGLRQSGHLSA